MEEIPEELKKVIDKRLGTLIMKESDDVSKAVPLVNRLEAIQTYPEYQEYLKEVEEDYKIKLNGFTDYLDETERIYAVGDQETRTYSDINTHQLNAFVDRLGNNDVGILYSNKPIELDEVLHYSRTVWNNLGKLVFAITPQKQLEGKIINIEWPGKKTIPLLTGVESDKDDVVEKKVVFYTESFDKRSYKKKLELTTNVFGYRFWCDEEKKEYLILSHKEIKNPETVEIIEGLHVKKSEFMSVGADTKLRAYTDIIHLTNFKPRQVGINMLHILVKGCSSKVEYVNENMKSILLDGLYGKYRHPEWFESLIYFWLLSGKKEYPLHLFIFQKGGGGKTTLMQKIADIMGIPKEDIWSGNKSTTTSLIPSFGTTPPDCGWMSKQKHVGLLDEFFGRKSNLDTNREMYEYDSIKDELVHTKSSGLSGRGSVTTTTTAKFMFASNLKYGINDLESFMDRTDPALVERMLVYIWNKNHEEFILSNRDGVLDSPDVEPPLPLEFYRELVVWCNSFTTGKPDPARMRKIRAKLKKVYTYEDFKSRAVEDYVDARMAHHALLLLDGIVKYRVLCSEGMVEDLPSRVPIEEDYEVLESTLEILSNSWVNMFDIKEFDVATRVRFLSGPARDVYKFVKDTVKEGKTPVPEKDVLAYCLNMLVLEPVDTDKALKHLLDWEVVVFDSGFYKPYWWKSDEDFSGEKRLLDFIRDEGEVTVDDIPGELVKFVGPLKHRGLVYTPDGKKLLVVE